MAQKLHQNRMVVVGQYYQDAHKALTHPAFKDCLERPALVATESQALTISGSVAGMHVATVYLTPQAHRGKNYQLAREALQRCLDRAGGRWMILNNDGTVEVGLP